MTAPNFNAHITGGGIFSGAGPGSSNLANPSFDPNDYAICVVGFEGSSPRSVVSVASAHLTFSPIHSFTSGGANNVTGEIWVAQNGGSTLSGEAVTVTLSGAVDDCTFIVFGVNGAWTAAPVDPNATNLSDVVVTGTNLYSGTISTDRPNDLILAISTTWKPNVNAGVPAAGWTNFNETTNSGGANFCSIQIDYKRVSSVQTSLAYALTSSSWPDSSNQGITTMFAITADSSDTNVSITGASATGSAGTVTVSTGGTISLAGVAATGSANPVTTSASHDGSGTVDGVSATGAANPVTVGSGGSTAISGASATGAAGDVTPSVSGAPLGVSALGVAGSVVAHAPPIPEAFPVFSIMRNTPVPAVGAMNNTPIVCIGKLKPSGPEPYSVAASISGVSARALSGSVNPSRMVQSALSGVSTTAAAGDVTVTIT